MAGFIFVKTNCLLQAQFTNETVELSGGRIAAAPKKEKD